jgi:glycosyl transferase family 25
LAIFFVQDCGDAMKRPHAFVISLKGSVDRRVVIQNRLRDLGIDYTVIDAVDGRQFENVRNQPFYDSLKRRLRFGRDMTRGELGCALSHRKVYEEIASRGLDNALVLEDDAILSDELPHVLKLLFFLPVQADIVRFLDRPKVYKRIRSLSALDDKYAIGIPYGTPGGAYGYCVTAKAARRLLNVSKVFWLPIDVLHGYTWLTKLRTYAVTPSPISPDNNVPSTIGDGRFDKKTDFTGFMRIACKATLFARKLYEMLLKNIFYHAAIERGKREIQKKKGVFHHLLGRLLHNIYRHAGQYYLKVRYGVRFLLDSRSSLDLHMLAKDLHEPRQLSLMTLLLRRGQVEYVFDIGANTGIYTLLAAKSGVPSHIFAFEPAPSTYHQLCANIFLNGLSERVNLLNKALGNIAGSPQETKKVLARTEAFDSLFNFSGKTAFAKINVGGHALEVLHGMQRSLKDNDFILQIKLQDEDRRSMVTAFMQGLGYGIHHRIDNDYYFSRT